MLSGNGKISFELIDNHATRDAFRVALSELGDAKWNWDTAHIPAPISRAEAAVRAGRQEEERREEGGGEQKV